ncbi:MAG TPA: AAA family ATPase [Solirubrobacterales bacterium]|jgi:chromosome segregation ATPase
MHLSSITIKGFKSFPERTKLVFSPGVSVIVGPNGCGKSNVTDAVLWALGEQSPLSVRGQSMQDMVYAGGEGVGPSRYAEVEVVLDSDGDDAAGFSELAIMRRLERGGEGTYRINGARARLADVIEVLSDANLGREMHSVISQGRVEEIVLSAPRDRRLLVEEAAGLGKHRKRRRRAQLKLERTRDNLDRALDVEREARKSLRPLKRQAEAADIHARLERQAAELRARLLASELHGHDDELAAAERTAEVARGARAELDAKLAEVGKRRASIEEQLAARESERTEAWGRLTAVRAAHERISVRAEALAARRSELLRGLERRRAALGALAEELAEATGARAGDDPASAGIERIGESLQAAIAALDRAREAGADGERGAELARVREAADRAAQMARRIEDMLGSRAQDSLSQRLEREAELVGALGELCEAAADARDAAGERAAALEQRMLGESGEDAVTDRLRACSREEAELQTQLRGAGEQVTEAEVRVAHLGDRRAEAAAELERIAATLGRELSAAEQVLGEEERLEIEVKLERLGRRREQLGPVNPLAESEYEQARAHVDSLETQRADLETALAELQGLIRETDRKIHAAFEQTFDATQRNFEELVEHLFPGGRGRLRLVDDRRGPKPVLGGAELDEAQPGADPAAPGGEAEEADGFDSGDEFSSQGVEIEVTPAGKATRRLSLLSGGEKALVALAFVFAVFLARPSPFYILDEVEAALDDANIDRFLQLVQRFSDRAQFIIVTHQKRTMDAAHVLYGVSMGKGGVTKVVSRKFETEAGQPQLDQGDEAIEAA